MVRMVDSLEVPSDVEDSLKNGSGGREDLLIVVFLVVLVLLKGLDVETALLVAEASIMLAPEVLTYLILK